LTIEKGHLKNPAASCGESSIPLERKHTYSRSLNPKQASRNALAVGFNQSVIRDEKGKKDNQDNKEMEGAGRPLDPPRKMLIVTTPAAKAPPPPWKGGKRHSGKVDLLFE
jgi:hypothetical protein